MTRDVLQRLASIVVVLLLISSIIFVAIQVLPGRAEHAHAGRVLVPSAPPYTPTHRCWRAFMSLTVRRNTTAAPGVASAGYSVLPVLAPGVGTELAGLLVELAFGTLGAVEVLATTRDEHVASARILEGLGSSVADAEARETDSHGDGRRVIRPLRRERCDT